MSDQNSTTRQTATPLTVNQLIALLERVRDEHDAGDVIVEGVVQVRPMPTKQEARAKVGPMWGASFLSVYGQKSVTLWGVHRPWDQAWDRTSLPAEVDVEAERQHLGYIGSRLYVPEPVQS